MGWAGASRPRRGGASILAVTTPGPGDQPVGGFSYGAGSTLRQWELLLQLQNRNRNRNNRLQRHPDSLTCHVGVWLWPLGPKAPSAAGPAGPGQCPTQPWAQTQRSPGGANHTSSGSHCFRVPMDAKWVWPVPEPAGSRDFPVARPSPTQPAFLTPLHRCGCQVQPGTLCSTSRWGCPSPGARSPHPQECRAHARSWGQEEEAHPRPLFL